MKTEAPGQIMKRLGELEDDFANNQLEHAELTGKVKEREAFLKTYEAKLFIQTDKDQTDGQRRMKAKQLLHDSPEHDELLTWLTRYSELTTTFEYLSKRASIGQSILKTMREETSAQYGAGKAQNGAS